MSGCLVLNGVGYSAFVPMSIDQEQWYAAVLLVIPGNAAATL
jgi:hypothetical protein